MDVKLSIIVPMYNAEEFIVEMIESALDGVDDSVEIIIVDDGSQDSSYKKCESYNDPRLRLFKQENSGAPVARNKGLKEAKGEYVIFFDADDFFATGAVKNIIEEISKEKHDCYVGNFYRFDGNKSKLEYKDLKWMKSLYDFYMFTPSPNSKVFRKSVLIDNQIEFEKIRLAQDLNFYLKFLGISNDIKPLDFPFFHYRYVGNSISHITNDRILDIGKSIDCAISFYDSHNVNKECYSYAYLNGVKHTNYQLYKLIAVDDINLIKSLYPKMVDIWNHFLKKAKLNGFSFVYTKKKLIGIFIQFNYRVKVVNRIKELERAGK